SAHRTSFERRPPPLHSRLWGNRGTDCFSPEELQISIGGDGCTCAREASTHPSGREHGTTGDRVREDLSHQKRSLWREWHPFHRDRATAGLVKARSAEQALWNR